jgi:hypothetical protein
MTQEGPPLAELLRHLRDAPPSFQRAPKTGALMGVDTYALVCDALAGPEVSPLDYADVAKRLAAQRDALGANALGLVQAAVWVLAHPSLAPADAHGRTVRATLLLDGFGEMTRCVKAAEVFRDDERAEELVRFILKELGLRPAGELPQVAADRMAAIDSVERTKVLADTRRTRERKVLEEMKRREAEAAAAKTSRE